MLDRRDFLRSGALGAAGFMLAPYIAFAQAETDRRFVFVILRGAADGLAIVAPTGDPEFTGVRRDFARHSEGGMRLGDFFTLHPALAEIGQLYGTDEALFAHAVASAYRERSHFDGQNVLETAASAPYGLRDGWMNRFVGQLSGRQAEAIALSSTMPMVLRGSAEASSYAPSRMPDPEIGLLRRVSMLYEDDPMLHADWAQAQETQELAEDIDGTGRGETALGELAARFLSDPDGTRIAAIELRGWDTHANQRGRLDRRLGALDGMIGALRTGLGTIWRDTLVIVATEFGRTAAPNGTGGTDHGTASAAMLLGGAVSGGRVLADWPGLRQPDLQDGRDLRPTMSMDRLFAGALAEHFALDLELVLQSVFPAAGAARLDGRLIRA
ncbi:MAG: DUF1501 domain-containing protein [Pseudomonadota bacterium]